MTLIKKNFNIKGMTCNSCEKIIAKQVLKLQGVKRINVNYATEKASIEFDDEKAKISEIKKAIEEKGYICEEDNGNNGASNNSKQSWGWILALVGVVILGYFMLNVFKSFPLPEISANMGYGLLFLVGLLTGFHCVSMCGGFVVSYTTKGIKEGKKPHQMHLSYAVGKTVSYTIIGAFFGLLGSIIAFTPRMRGYAGIIAGLFLLLYGLKLLNIFPALRKFGLPNFISKFAGKESHKYSGSPFVIGLLNGLMIACGPLQAIYIMAAGTGSAWEGAKLLFVFGLGTLPVMLGFGYLTSFISSKATHKILKASAIIVMILGIIMINRGLSLTGNGYDFNSLTARFDTNTGNSETSPDSGLVIKDGYQEIRMDVNRYGWSPNKFVLQKGVPVKWIIDGKELNGCNSGIQVPELGLRFEIKPGLQTIEFTPTKSGTISWSCTMGMIPGVFIVKDQVDTNTVNQDLNQVQVPKGSSCGMGGGGGCGCGGAR